MALDAKGFRRLERALEALLPPGVAVAARDPALPVPEADIFDSEAAAMARAVPRRRAEFLSGRDAAHRAMAALGHPRQPVLMAANRAPVWPDGLTGTISHCEGAAVALVADAARYPALAVDIEPDAALPPELIDTVCLPREMARLDRLAPEARGRMARLIFSAKETVYKLRPAGGGKMLEFSDVEITLAPEAGRFSAQVQGQAGAGWAGPDHSGRFGRSDGFVYCVMYVAQGADIQGK